MVAQVRADEACHRDLNHHFADIPYYHDVETHTVTIVERQEGDSSVKGLEFRARLDSGDNQTEKDSKV